MVAAGVILAKRKLAAPAKNKKMHTRTAVSLRPHTAGVRDQLSDCLWHALQRLTLPPPTRLCPPSPPPHMPCIHTGVLIDADLAGTVTPLRSSSALAASDGADVKGGSTPLEEFQGRAGLSARAVITTAGRGQPGVDANQDGRGGGWGKRWEAHRQEMLREFGGAHGSGGDQV